MFGFLGSLFGTAKAGEKLVDGVSKGIDKMFYTSEEKAEDMAKARKEGFKVYMKWLESTTGSRLARRIIALMVTGIWALEHLSSVVLGAASNWGNYDKLMNASKMLADNASANNALVGTVLLFYFGGPAAIDGVKSMVSKWVDKK